ncbi:MAG: tRNA (adenosine(37)-N6)-dimethylallyltransferase MiaA [Alphaproteobacteria bacterium]|nr:tRNA (adenosine(37)-N6)-dimethylallyltransferase MiaA [Alphaproteobacteria bacterium]
MSRRKIILIGGPTASGKSALAMQIARREKGAIINADAMQVYAGLPVLTAQPDIADRAEIPHLLYEITDPAEASSAGKWLTQAQNAIAQVTAAGRTPILVGGTGLYFRALLGGLADIPPIPDAVRVETAHLYDQLGEEEFRAALAGKDPESAARIARNDRQRLVRAYEVVAHTGKALAAWQQDGAAATAGDDLYERRLVLPPRDALYAACDKRFVSMIDRGAIDEVRDLMARNLSPALPAMKILGLREIAAYLRDEITRADMTAKAQQATRNYAKRQMTWFRNQWKDYRSGDLI